jgi:CDK inhibitor PHO81
VATCLLNITDLSSGLKFEGPAANGIFTQQILTELTSPPGPFRDLEKNLRKALTTSDSSALLDCVHYSDLMAQQSAGGKTNVARILWKVIIEAPPDLANLILSSLSSPFDFQFVDDINGRTCLHEAAIAGSQRMVALCIQNNVAVNKPDVYGRAALHYAAMKGHSSVCQHLLDAGATPTILDRDNYSPLVYATLKGDVASVRVLLENGRVPVRPSTETGDLSPLSLAAQAGHTDVVVLLLGKGAVSLPNSNGEYPIHLAAQEGHPVVCRLLLQLEGWDTPDKYHEWTPLFHAARYGRAECVRILIEGGCRVSMRDELGHNGAHYAAWYGHRECLEPLLRATVDHPPPGTQPMPNRSPMSDITMPTNDFEIDAIPSLSLPPPIMPHRAYGHNHLIHTHLVQITIGHSTKMNRDESGVRIHHRLISPFFKDEYLLATAPLKLVMTAGPHADSPHTISLPQSNDEGTFAFQISNLEDLSLEFSIYPNFGTKTIGRAVALPSMFRSIENHQLFTLPILDKRLHTIGEVRLTFYAIHELQILTTSRSTLR